MNKVGSNHQDPTAAADAEAIVEAGQINVSAPGVEWIKVPIAPSEVTDQRPLM